MRLEATNKNVRGGAKGRVKSQVLSINSLFGGASVIWLDK